MNTMNLRQATDADAPTIVSLIHSAFEEYRTLLVPPSGVYNESVESVREKIKTGGWVIAESNEQAVGCVWYENRGDYVYLGRLAVLPEYRQQGIASALIQYVEAKAIELGIPRVQLGVRLKLTVQRAAYERRGYHIIEYKTHDGFTEPTWVMMEKIIS